MGGLDPAGELIRCDERDRLAPPPPDQDRFTRIRDLIHQRGQALSGLRIGRFVDHSRSPCPSTELLYGYTREPVNPTATDSGFGGNRPKSMSSWNGLDHSTT